jgi:ABC-type multidrug transport system fused ATPase/permease subunit
MAALLLVLAILGAGVVADLVVENTGTGVITVLGRPVTGYRDGLLLAAALGLVMGLLLVGSLSLRRTRRARRQRLRVAERELRGHLLELEGENTQLREELARRDSAARRVAGVAAAAGLEAPAAAGRVPSPLADHQVEPIYEEARRVARLRSSAELSLPSTHR